MDSSEHLRLFEITSDFEFYCYLKAHLPAKYTIVSKPLKSYYSERYFRYLIHKEGKFFKEYTGSFDDIEKEYLVGEAKKILESIGA